MNPGEPELSVVVPLHNEQGNAGALCEEIGAALDSLGRSYEVLLINDGSTDRTPAILDAIAATDPRFRPVHLDANYGQSAALTAGFQTARGRYVLTMDGDLQNDPTDFQRLLTRLEQGGFNVVSGWREKRTGNVALRVIPSQVANRLISWVSGLPSWDNGCSVKVYRSEVVRRVMLPHGFHRFLPSVLGVQPEEFDQLPVSDRKRHSGRGHYGLSRFFAVVRDLLVLRFVTRGRAQAWLPAITGFCVVAFVFALAALLLWSGGHSTAGTAVCCVAAVMLSYGLTIRGGLIRWVRTQAEPPYRVRKASSPYTQVAEIVVPRERRGTPAGGVPV